MPIRYLSNVATLTYDRNKCTGCGMCVIVCPHRVFRLNHGKAEIIDRDRCMECGACMMNCAFGAVSVDAGVGCAKAVIQGALRGTAPECGCSSSTNAVGTSLGCCGARSPSPSAGDTTDCCGSA